MFLASTSNRQRDKSKMARVLMMMIMMVVVVVVMENGTRAKSHLLLALYLLPIHLKEIIYY